MKNFKLDIKTVGIILLLLSLIGLLVTYLVGYNGLEEKRIAFEEENAVLGEQVARLQELMDNKQRFLDETDQWEREMEEIKEKFPSRVTPEGQIMYANGMESSYDIIIEGVEMPMPIMVEVEMPVEEETVTEPPATEDAAENSEEEGTDAVDSNEVDIPLVSANRTISLYNAITTVSSQATYGAIKQMVKQINSDPERKSISNISIAYNEKTGNLDTVMLVNMFSLTGTDATYQPPVVTGIGIGRPNIFGTTDKLNRPTAKDTGDEETADGKVADDKSDSEEDETEEEE